MTNNMELLGWEFKKGSTKKMDAPYLRKENDDAAFVVGSGFYGHNSYHLSFDQSFDSENELIKKYRDLSLLPEIDEAITDIVNESIAGDNDSSPVEIILDNLEVSDKIKDKIRTEFESILKLLDFNSEAYEIYRKWYIDARLYYHIIISDKPKQNGIKELRYVSPLKIKKIREEETEAGPGGYPIIKSVHEYYLYSPSDAKNSTIAGIKLSKDSVCAVTSGLLDDTHNRIYSFLHKAIKPANQLRMLEDATIIYRLSRAPERRAFYVDVGNLPKNKAEEYLRSVKNAYKQKMVYDARTGEVKDSTDVMSMMEDFWMPRREGGRGTEIVPLAGGQNLGEIDDLEYFKRKLYNSLSVPYSRISPDGNNAFTIGRASEITRDEIKYSKFISRLRKRFSKLFYELLRVQLLLKQIITENEWETIKENVAFDFISDMYFKELKEAEILRERVNLYNDIEGLIGKHYSKEYVRKNILMLSDVDIEIMEKQIAKEALEEEPDTDTEDDESESESESPPETDIDAEEPAEANDRKKIKDQDL